MKPKIRLTRKEKRLIRKANTMIIEKANMNPVASIPIAYALMHGYVVIEEENDDGWVLTKEVKARSKEVKKTEAEE